MIPFVDHTPPVMTVEPIPERINNSREFEFRFNEISTAFCSLEKLGHSSIFHKCGEGLEITYKPYDLMDNTSYTLAVKGIDGVGNECNVSLHVFTTGNLRIEKLKCFMLQVFLRNATISCSNLKQNNE